MVSVLLIEWSKLLNGSCLENRACMCLEKVKLSMGVVIVWYLRIKTV